MATLYKETVAKTTIDADGNETSDILEKTRTYDRVYEPGYIKLYIEPWTAMKPDGTSKNNVPGIPAAYRELFIQLAMRMTYCNSNDIKDAQIVHTGIPFCYEIMEALDWKNSMYYKGLKVLAEHDVIRKVARGIYRVNPVYAARGEWLHNDKLNRGGIKNLVDEFKRKPGHNQDSQKGYTGDIGADIKYVWGDDGRDTPGNKMWREGLGIGKGFDGGSLRTVTRKNRDQ